ncbi:unnamed protein product, partial [Mesorhabditis belari]|uniref:Major sperm protein n=1 Tax=Mesorhabditis belari TaxID=2138241 RepID=A0AAF3FEP4_9BILA
MDFMQIFTIIAFLCTPLLLMCSKKRKIVEAEEEDGGERLLAGKSGKSKERRVKKSMGNQPARTKKSKMVTAKVIKSKKKVNGSKEQRNRPFGGQNKARGQRSNLKTRTQVANKPSTTSATPMSPSLNEPKKTSVVVRAKESAMSPQTVFEMFENSPSLANTQLLNLNELFRRKEEALEKEKLQRSKMMEEIDEIYRSPERDEINLVPDLLNNPNLYSPVKANPEKVLWSQGMKTFELRLLNTNYAIRAFKMRCTDNSIFQIDPVFGYVEGIETKKPFIVKVTVKKPLTTQQSIKVESIEVEGGNVEPVIPPCDAFKAKDIRDRQFTIVQVIPPPHS